ASKETLDKCTSAGATFGDVVGSVLNFLLTPAKALLDALGWILEKLGVLPDEAERARKKIEDTQRQALLNDKIALLQGDITKVAPKKTDPVKNESPGDGEWNSSFLFPGMKPFSPFGNGNGTSKGTETGTETKTGKASGTDLTGHNKTGRKLGEIADNTKGMLDETRKRIGPGDIVFKDL
ncbi:putative phage tail tape measure protein, partial [Trabulsiella guamensis ATCC 49490]